MQAHHKLHSNGPFAWVAWLQDHLRENAIATWGDDSADGRKPNPDHMYRAIRTAWRR
jgi:hypothetical protein